MPTENNSVDGSCNSTDISIPYLLSAKIVKLVLDSSIGVKTIIPEHDSAKAWQLQSDRRKGIHELLAPDLYLLEVSNILISAHRSGKVAVQDLPFTYLEMFRQQPVISPVTTYLPNAFKIASQIRVSVYDAIYLAMSQQESCLLITADQKLINAAPGFSFLTLDQL
jgi:predicted nucleic acid-binding protein